MSDRLARDYLRRAKARRIALEALMAATVYPDVVRESQDVVELILKGALRFVGVDPPKRHDVHAVVARFVDRFPAEWRETLGKLQETLVKLARERGPAFYGDEEASIPASELFGEADARRAVAVVDHLLAMYARLLEPQGQG